MSRRLAYDIETNGLLPELHTLHMVTAEDMDTGEEFYFGPPVPEDFEWAVGKEPSAEARRLLANPSGTAEEGARRVMAAELAIAHNGCGFDYLALEKLFPWFVRPPRAWDTQVIAKLIWPADVLADPDFARWKKGLMPINLVKRHSLKAWGYRLGEHKEEYSGDLRIADPEDRKARMWAEWNPYMAAYGLQDVAPMMKLWQLAEKRLGWTGEGYRTPDSVVEMEHDVARLLAEQEGFGVRFDREKAQVLAAHLSNEKARIERDLVATFGSWWQAGSVTTPARAMARKREDFPYITRPRFGKNGRPLKDYHGPVLEHYDPEAPYTPIERLTFKPSSRDHLGMRLKDVFGWRPKKFGKNGKPTVDESVLEEIPEAVVPPETRQLLLDFFVVNKTLGMVANGAKAWLNLVTDEGRMHGRVDPLGTITGRGAHSNPNLGQCPSVRKKKVLLDGVSQEVVLRGLEGRYGAECRELFTADEGWEQTGVDASSLELILLGHYLYPMDEGLFSARVCDPTRDAHTEHAEIAGVLRSDAKTTIYLIIYGGSAYKLSLDRGLVVTSEQVPELLAYRGLPMLLRSLEKRFDADFVAKMDDMQKARLARARLVIVKLSEGIAGLKDLMEGVQSTAKERGWLKAFDGRKLTVRKAHAALNTALQSAGAQACKLWMVKTHQKLKERGHVSGTDYKQVLWIHDELQFTHRPGLGPTIKAVAEEAMKEAGEELGLRGVFRTDGKTGANWFECH